MTFDPLSFNQTGTYVYYMVEQAGDDSEITYDSTIYKVTITVTSSSDYHASVFYEKDGIAYDGAQIFVNTTNSKPIEPEIPSKPETPTKPIEPEIPSKPEIPTKPVEPEIPSKPQIPEKPNLATKTNNPQTGDNSNLYVSLLVFSSMGLLVVVLLYSRKRKCNP